MSFDGEYRGGGRYSILDQSTGSLGAGLYTLSQLVSGGIVV